MPSDPFKPKLKITYECKVLGRKFCYGCYFNNFVSHFPKSFPSLGYLETLLDHQYTCLFLSCPKITIKRAVMVAKSHAWFFPSHFQSKYFISFPQGPPPYKAIIEIIKIEAIKLLLLTGLPISNIDRHWSFIHQLFKHSKIWGGYWWYYSKAYNFLPLY